MKIKAKIIIVFVGLSVLLSCDSWMELIPPQGLIREEFWKTKEDVEAVVMGAYESFSRMDRKLFLFGELRGDMVTPDYSLGWSERLISESSIYPDNWLCNWSDFYEVINYCNEVIKNAEAVQDLDDTFTDYQLQGYLSEAIFLRALNYFYLVRIYKDVPYITEPTETDDADFYVTKTDGDEILEYLIADLEEYRKYATVDGYITLEEIKGRATKASYDALLADINLWMFNYDEVLTHIAKIEANRDYVLMPQGSYFDLYYPGNSLESIFELQFNTENDQNNSLYGLTFHDNHQIDPSDAAIEAFAVAFDTKEKIRGEDTGIRKVGENNYVIWKYVGRANDGETSRTSAEQSSANFIIYRLADILLMKAEALSQLGDYTQALFTMNEIKTRASSDPVSIAETPASFEDAILYERSLELAFEGKRWFDLLRMGRRNDFQRKDKFIDIALQNAPTTQKRILQIKLSNPNGWYLPIYEGELERNKNLVQNPYYNF